MSVVACFALSLTIVVAQEDVPDFDQDRATSTPTEERLVIETREKDRPVMTGLKPEREFQRRLPNGFGPLVNATHEQKSIKFKKSITS